MTVTEILVGAAVELFFVAIAAAVLYRLWGWFFPVPTRLIVPAFQRGVVLLDDRVEKILDPGAHWIGPKRRLLLCDMRPTPFQVLGQELLTEDGMAVRISLGGEYRICNPSFFVTQSSDAFGAFDVELRQALLSSVGELTSEGFRRGQAQITARIKELMSPKAAQLGIEMTQLDVCEAVPIGWLSPL